MDTFVRKYALSKTLRFELKPVGETAEKIEDFKNKTIASIVEQDKKRAEDYKQIKKIIDDYHRYFIEQVLSQEILTDEDIQKAFDTYDALKATPKDKDKRTQFNNIQGDLRKKIAKKFKERFKIYCLFDAGLINESAKNGKGKLYKWLEQNNKLDPEKEGLIKNFNGWFTYFEGFNKNRKNMYSDEKQQTAISYRIVNDNMVKHFNNCLSFEAIQQNHKDLAEQLKDYNDIFNQTNFKNYLNQIGIEGYNEKIGHIKQLINLYRQQIKIEDKKNKLPKMTVLFNQILSIKESKFKIDAFEKDKQMLKTIEQFYLDIKDDLEGIKTCLGQYLTEDNLKSIYIKKDSLTDISQAMFKDWGFVNKALESYVDNILKLNNKQKEKILKHQTYSIKEIQAAINEYTKDEDFEDINITNKNIARYFAEFKVYDKDKEKDEYLITRIENAYQVAKEVLLLEKLDEDRSEPNDGREGGKGFLQVEKIKEMLDSIMAVVQFAKPLYLFKKGEPIEVDGEKYFDFYDTFEGLYKNISDCIGIYNKARNRITKKPEKMDKFKLNFKKSNLLGGFVESRTEESDNGTQYGAYLFRKRRDGGDYGYFLGLSEDAKLFRFHESDYIEENDKSEYERIYYYQMLPKSFYGNSYVGDYSKDKQTILRIISEFLRRNDVVNEKISDYLNGKTPTPIGILKLIKKESGDLYKILCNDKEFLVLEKTIIDSFRETLKKYKGKMADIESHLKNFPNKLEDAINTIDTISNTRFMVPKPVSRKELAKVFPGENVARPLYLFEITNKDLAERRKDVFRGKDNLHTMYFKGIWETGQTTIDIGKGEVFCREASPSKNKFKTHEIGEILKHKRHSDDWEKLGSPISRALKAEDLNSLSPNLEIINTKRGQEILYDGKIIGKVCTHKITKDKRFTADKFFFHLSTELNYQIPEDTKSKAFGAKFNNWVNDYLKDHPVNIIGIDRGERNLLYYVVIDKNRNIIDQGSFDIVEDSYEGGNMPTNYHKLLNEKEKQRDAARKSWSTIENIKELKSGYLSRIVHKIATLMTDKPAIVVLEDLSIGFKRSRFFREKQVYQKFEKALIDKLNYLVFKNKTKGEAGHYLSGYQLTAPFTSFDDIEQQKQTGFLFYVLPHYTSNIDPITGFVNLLDTNIGKEESKRFFGKFDSIVYNAQKDYFEFSFNYANFPPDKSGSKKDWTVCTAGGKRYRYDRDKKNYIDYDVTAELKKLFDEHGISYKNGENLVNAISNQIETAFFKNLLFYLSLTLQLRHRSEKEDFILSPVEDKNGNFFDSRKAKENQPKDADANGAYNIARKGMMVLEQISKEGKPDVIKNADWFNFAQGK